MIVRVGHGQLRSNTQVLSGKVVPDIRNIGGIPDAERM